MRKQQPSGQQTREETSDEAHGGESEESASDYEENLNDLSVVESALYGKACVTRNSGRGFVAGAGVSLSTIDESVGGGPGVPDTELGTRSSMPSMFSNSTAASTSLAMTPCTNTNRGRLPLQRAKDMTMEVEFVSCWGPPVLNRYTGTYSGSLNDRGQMHGAGIFKFDVTDDLYVGEFDCGNLHGCGVLKIDVPLQEFDITTGDVVVQWTTHFLKGFFYLNDYLGADPDETWLEEIDSVRGYRG
jgi:hypothetical protein